MAQQFLNPDLSAIQLTQQLQFRVLMVVNAAAQKIKFPELVLNNEIIIGLPKNSQATKTLLEKKTTRFDITNYLTNIQWNCSSKEGITMDKRPMGATPIELSLSIDNFGNNFNLLPRGTMFIVQIRNPMTSTVAEWRPILTCYLWEKSINVSGTGSEISLTCVDRLKWLELSDGPKAFDIDSEFGALSGKSVFKIIESLAKTYKFPLGKMPTKSNGKPLPVMDYVPPLKALTDKSGSSLLDFIVLLLNMAAGNEEIKNKKKVSFDIHARDGKVNILPVTTPKKILRVTDESMIVEGTLQESVREGFATQYVLASKVQVEVPPAEIDGTGTPAGDILAGNIAGQYSAEVNNETGTIRNAAGSAWPLEDGPVGGAYISLDGVGSPVVINFKPDKSKAAKVYNFPTDAVFHNPVAFGATEVDAGDKTTAVKGRFGFPQIPGSKPDKGASNFYFEGFLLKDTPTGKTVGYFGGDVIVRSFKDGTKDVFPRSRASVRSAGSDSDSSPGSASLQSKSVEIVPYAANSGARSSIVAEQDPNVTKETSSAYQKQSIKIPVGTSKNVTLVVSTGGSTGDVIASPSRPISVSVPDSPALQTMVKTNIVLPDKSVVYTFPKLEGNLSSYQSGISFIGTVKTVANPHLGTITATNPDEVVGVSKTSVTLTGYYQVITWVKSGTDSNGLNPATGALSTAPTFEEKSKPVYINPTSPYPQKAYGIIRKEQTPGEWSGNFLDVDPKSINTQAKHKVFAKKLLDESITPEFTLDMSIVGVLGIWQNTFIYIDSTRIGIKGAFLVTKVNYTVTGGHVAVDITVKPNLKSRLTVEQTTSRLNQPGFLRY